MATASTSPPSASNSDNSALSHKPNTDGPSDCNNNGSSVVDSQEMKPETAKIENTEIEEDLERYRKLEAEYTRYLNAKYFSNKDIFGGIIFDEKTAINNGTIKSSRWPGTRSYADPMQAFEEQSSNSPTSRPETPTTISNGKFPTKS